MNGHVGYTLIDCPACPPAIGQGMKFAASHIKHAAQDETDLDLAELCEWAAESHRPGSGGVCVECGEPWTLDTDAGLIPCEAFSSVRIEKNFWIMRNVSAIAAKWRHRE